MVTLKTILQLLISFGLILWLIPIYLPERNLLVAAVFGYGIASFVGDMLDILFAITGVNED